MAVAQRPAVCFRSGAEFGAATVIYKIADKNEWAAAEQAGRYDGSANDMHDGFIHFSKAEQVAGTLAKYYADVDNLVLAAIDEAGLDALRWEPSRDGALFPHLYAPLAMTAVVWVKPLTRDAGGAFVLPPELGE
jgi:uncharacterized protein (DUF952 family)